LSEQVGRTVVDKTGLGGNDDITLNWTPEPGQAFGPFGGRRRPHPFHRAPLRFTVPLDDLDPGEYLCQVTVLDGANRKAGFGTMQTVI
jgi:uncharacterized protein (TIGR03435 family)